MNGPKTGEHIVALVDIGNTRMKIGWVDLLTGTREHASLALEHRNVDQLDAWFRQQNIQPGRAIGVNVAGPDKARAIENRLQTDYEIPIRWLGSEPQTAGVLNRYTDPSQLGPDRWIAMVGLSQTQTKATTPLLLASFGTATTLDTLCPASRATPVSGTDDPGAILPKGIEWVYDGGLIFPGPGLMRSSLANNTARLPVARGTVTAFPVDTHKAIVTGIAAAQAGAVIRQWQAGLSRYGIAPRVYGTGGGWPAVQDEVQALLALIQHQNDIPEQPIQYLSSPILDGLAAIALI